jgi:hypothetical protein
MLMCRMLVGGALVSSLLACSDLSNTAFPAGITDPHTYNTEAGALRLYEGAVYSFTGGAEMSAAVGGVGNINGDNGAFVRFVLTSGLLTDELQAGNLGGTTADYLAGFSITSLDSIDARLFPEEPVVYDALQNVRGAARQAIGALAAYAPTASPALRGHLYALAGYAELALADLYCSGVPLSTLDFNADFTYQPGSTTTQVYQHALTLFDTAITLSTDSTRLLNLAQVGKGRALLALGRYADAAQAVTSVPTTYQYAFYVNWGVQNNKTSVCTLFECTGMTVADYEGTNGLPYLTSGDPRSLTEQYDVNEYGVPQYAPQKYGATTPVLAPLVLASGVEARLIEAEAALHTGDVSTWLTTLNALRTDGTFTTTPASDPASVGAIDTTWHTGTGGVAGLSPLRDPGTDSARVALLFTERAYWLFLTGERQGDLRRLVRNYGRDPETVYPTGAYPIGAQLPQYGRDVSVNIPRTEYLNPKFTGCLSRGV